jgi:hypothetical protein
LASKQAFLWFLNLEIALQLDVLWLLLLSQYLHPLLETLVFFDELPIQMVTYFLLSTGSAAVPGPSMRLIFSKFFKGLI